MTNEKPLISIEIPIKCSTVKSISGSIDKILFGSIENETCQNIILYGFLGMMAVACIFVISGIAFILGQIIFGSCIAILTGNGHELLQNYLQNNPQISMISGILGVITVWLLLWIQSGKIRIFCTHEDRTL